MDPVVEVGTFHGHDIFIFVQTGLSKDELIRLVLGFSSLDPAVQAEALALHITC